MGVRPKFTKSDISKMFRERRALIEEVIINRLILIGERFVKNARENGGYLDQTGNLRSSIGYVVLKNGVSIKENFEQSKKGTDKVSGRNKGESFIKSLSDDFAIGYCLIVVAGMEYAAAVESKGRDVLTSSSQIAETELRKAMNDISRKLNRR